jgi:hypothetical protein
MGAAADACAAAPLRRLQIDVNILPNVCSYEACGNCTKYGTFPCAWCVRVGAAHARRACWQFALTRAPPRRYKILFVVLGLVGLYFTRGLYSDNEVTYAPRVELACDCCSYRTTARDRK